MGTVQRKNLKVKDGTPIVLRHAIQEDATSLNRLAQNVFSTSKYLIITPEEFSSFTEEQQKERIQSYQEDEGNILIVAEHNGELIGMLDFQSGKRERISHKGIFGMSVHSLWRGKGVGHRLLLELIAWVQTHPHIEFIHLGVREDNNPAIALYSKMGFQVIGRDPFSLQTSDGNLHAELSMSLRVTK